MLFNLETVRKAYALYPERVAAARAALGRPLTLAEKILYAHLVPGAEKRSYARGADFAEFHPDQTIHVFLSTNDSQVSAETYQQACPKVVIHHFKGSAPEDLFMLSECDYLIGPPSTFSLVAAMYRDIPVYRMDAADEQQMTPESFRLFDYWFRRIL